MQKTWNYIQGGSFNLIRNGRNRTGPSSTKIEKSLELFPYENLSFKEQIIRKFAGEFLTFFLS